MQKQTNVGQSVYRYLRRLNQAEYFDAVIEYV